MLAAMGMTAAAGALGIDVGSTTVKVVLLGADLCSLASSAARHRGRPREALDSLLRELGAHLPGERPRAGVTGSLGLSLADELGATSLHEVSAVALSARRRFPGARTVIELGGQDAKILRLGERSSSDDAQMNDRCAAGTGATLDRLAARLSLEPGELERLELRGDLSVSSRCGVFAERDVVALVKRGASREEALSAALRAIVRANLGALSRGRPLEPPVLLLGGPHAHLPALVEAWREALVDSWRKQGIAGSGADVTCPPEADRFGALGAALHARGGGRPAPLVGGVHATRRVDGPLPRGAEEAPSRLRCSPPPAPLSPGKLRAHLGIDAGSTTSKAVLLDEAGELLAAAYGPSGGDPLSDARARLGELARRCREQGASLEIASLGVTGYGAPIVGPALGADAAIVETLAHAAAARAVDPAVEVVVDVGGTDVKVLRLEGERIAEMHLSNQCAAGLGAFLASTAADLGIAPEQAPALALAAARAPRFSPGCAVFMDTDRVTFQREGHGPGELLAGLSAAIPRAVWEFVVPVGSTRLGRRFLLTGGTHANLAVAVAHAAYLEARDAGASVRVHPHPGHAGAIGAALAGRDEASRRGQSRFLGLDSASSVSLRVVTGEQTRCDRCDLGCARSIISVAGARGRPEASIVVGNACERGATPIPSKRRSSRHAPDLFEDEGRRLFRRVLPPPAMARRRRASGHDRVVMGIPRVMGLYRCAPLVLHYLVAAGLDERDIVLSPPTSPSLLRLGEGHLLHDPCFPAKVVPSHVAWLLDQGITHLFLPAVTHASIAVRGTADTASCPIVAACGHVTLAALRAKGADRPRPQVLSPEMCLSSPERLGEQLFEAFGPLLGLSDEEHRDALAFGLRAQRAFLDRSRARGARVLAQAASTGTAVAVVLARPYHTDPGIHHGVSTELASRGLPVLGVTALPHDGPSGLDVSDLLPHATNSGCAEKAWAARVVSEHPGLVAVDLSSFRCGQDASVHGLLSDLLSASGRPFLRVHDLDEEHPGSSLRLSVDTFVAAVRAHEASLAPAGCA